MSYDGWMAYNGEEVVNLSRTAQLAEALGITTVWQRPAGVAWIQADLAGQGYRDITRAPWYDPQYPASSEFAGLVPLGVQGLDDSTLESTPIEYITDGGHSGKPRSATLPIVFNVALVARTDRGAEYGLRWLNRVLRETGRRTFCNGADLHYFRYGSAGAPKVHRRDVRLTRGTSVTRKRRNECSTTWTVTFTMTAADPYEYGEEVSKITALGATAGATGPGVSSSGTLVANETACPKYNYTPIYDPLYPALVAAPGPPDFLPAGWGIKTGDAFQRTWARITPVEPSGMLTVPVIKLTASQDARMVRLSVWPGDSTVDDQCDPLFAVVVSYLPPNLPFYIDGEEKAAYAWDGVAPAVRRADSLIYAPDANPVQWAAFNDHSNLLVTLDTFALSGGGYQGGGTVRASLALVPKSD